MKVLARFKKKGNLYDRIKRAISIQTAAKHDCGSHLYENKGGQLMCSLSCPNCRIGQIKQDIERFQSLFDLQTVESARQFMLDHQLHQNQEDYFTPLKTLLKKTG